MNPSLPSSPHPLDVTTTAREVFTHCQSQQLATLLWLRFGRNDHQAAAAWRRMLENDCPTSLFMKLVATTPI